MLAAQVIQTLSIGWFAAGRFPPRGFDLRANIVGFERRHAERLHEFFERGRQVFRVGAGCQAGREVPHELRPKALKLPLAKRHGHGSCLEGAQGRTTEVGRLPDLEQGDLEAAGQSVLTLALKGQFPLAQCGSSRQPMPLGLQGLVCLPLGCRLG